MTKPREDHERDRLGSQPLLEPAAEEPESELGSGSLPQLSGPIDQHDLQPMAAANDNVDLEGLGVADFTPLAIDEAASALALDLNALSDPATAEDADVDAEPESGPAMAPATVAEPDVSTRAQTHVAPEAWFDATLDLARTREAASDARQRLIWRFRSTSAAYRLLLPTAPTAEARALMMNALRRYERLLRKAAGVPRDATPPAIEALHSQLSESQADEVDRAMSELEGILLTMDECLPDAQFEARFAKQHVVPKQLLRYARFLAARPFGVGYRRDRFERIAFDLLTTKLPSGKLLLMQRKRAAPVLQQLLRGLSRSAPMSGTSNTHISYLCDSLDRLISLTIPQRFFDSGYYLDVYGYKISMHERVTSPEFLYLSVAIDVEVHNRLQSWSQAAYQPGADRSLATLQDQLRAQRTAAQAVFPDFQRPVTGVTREGRAAAASKAVARRSRPSRSSAGSASWLRYGAASAIVLAVLGANLYTSGLVRLKQPAVVLNQERLRNLSPLLINGRLSANGKHFDGLISRPNWNHLSPRQREDAANELARALKLQGIDHAELLAYKSRVMQIDFGSVVFIDSAH